MFEFLIILLLSTLVIVVVIRKNFTHKIYDRILYNDEIMSDEHDGGSGVETVNSESSSEHLGPEDLIEEEILDEEFTDSEIKIDSESLIKEILSR